MNKEKWQEYVNVAHGMQTGVAYVMEKDPKETEPKHLRVGINSAMSDQKALARLLIAKGIFTEEEYVDAIIESMREEKEMYEERVRQLYGHDGITLA